jgi:hypothetical protein
LLEKGKPAMTLDFDTFLVALYTMVDDLYKAHAAPLKPNRPGPEVQVSDSEILTLMLLAQVSHRSERAMLRYAKGHLRDYFPHLLDQSAHNRRVRDLMGVMIFLIQRVAEELAAQLAAYQTFDLVPLPLLRRCRGVKHRLFANEADIGYGGSDRDWFYGCQLLVAATSSGVITGFLLGPASTEGRWLAESFLCWRANRWSDPLGPHDLPPSHHRGGKRKGPSGSLAPRDAVGTWTATPYVVDDGFRGRFWFAHWRQDYGAMVMTPSGYQGTGTREARHQHSRWRQIIETVNSSLDGVFALAFPGAKMFWGVVTRVAAKLLAYNLGIWLNRLFGLPDLAFATLFSF